MCAIQNLIIFYTLTGIAIYSTLYSTLQELRTNVSLRISTSANGVCSRPPIRLKQI